MALALKKIGSLLTQHYFRDAASSSLRYGGLFIRGLPVNTDSNPQKKGDDTRQEKNVDSQERKEKITKEEIFSASSPQAPIPSEGSGGQIN